MMEDTGDLLARDVEREGADLTGRRGGMGGERLGVDRVFLAHQEEARLRHDDAAARPDGAAVQGEVEASLLDRGWVGHFDLLRRRLVEAGNRGLADDGAVFTSDIADGTGVLREGIKLPALGALPGLL